MTQLDENDLVEYNMIASVANALGGGFTLLLGIIWFGGLSLICFFIAGCMLLGAFGVL